MLGYIFLPPKVLRQSLNRGFSSHAENFFKPRGDPFSNLMSPVLVLPQQIVWWSSTDSGFPSNKDYRPNVVVAFYSNFIPLTTLCTLPWEWQDEIPTHWCYLQALQCKEPGRDSIGVEHGRGLFVWNWCLLRRKPLFCVCSNGCPQGTTRRDLLNNLWLRSLKSGLWNKFL